MQIPIPYPAIADYAPENFFVTQANEKAYGLVQNPELQGAPGILLIGEEGSGKTHLAHMWQQSGHGEVIDDLGRYQEEPEELFHVLSRIKNDGALVLCTARHQPDQLDFKLADVTSRLKALVSVTIDAPDDALIEMLFAKHFADRQITVSPDVVAYLMRRAERSYSAIQKYVELLDQSALSKKRDITIPMAREVLSP